MMSKHKRAEKTIIIIMLSFALGFALGVVLARTGPLVTVSSPAIEFREAGR